MSDHGEFNHAARRDALMWNLRIDAATAEVVATLRDRGIGSVVLKGPALTPWYPPDSGRTYVDGDVWVGPADQEIAENTLRELGFVATRHDDGVPEQWRHHAGNWTRERDRASIDLHRRLQAVGLAPQRVWEILWPRTQPLAVGGVEARRLDDAALALYLTLHAFTHGAGDPRGLPHLNAALLAVNESTWAQAMRLATELDASEGFSAGLRLLPAGAELAERLSLPRSRSVETALRGSTPPPVALGFEQLAAASSAGRVRILARKLFPPPAFIRHWWPPAARGPHLLAVGYLYRPIWLLRRAPAGYRAWRAAQLRSRS